MNRGKDWHHFGLQTLLGLNCLDSHLRYCQKEKALEQREKVSGGI